MIYRTPPSQPRAGGSPSFRDPDGRSWPLCGRLSAYGEAAVSPPPPAAFLSPPGPWDRRSRGRPAWGGIGFGGQKQKQWSGARELQREPRGGGNIWKCGCGVGKEQAEKTREVGWGKGKGKGSNQIPGSRAPHRVTHLGGLWILSARPLLSFPWERSLQSPQVWTKGRHSDTPLQYSVGGLMET